MPTYLAKIHDISFCKIKKNPQNLAKTQQCISCLIYLGNNVGLSLFNLEHNFFPYFLVKLGKETLNFLVILVIRSFYVRIQNHTQL